MGVLPRVFISYRQRETSDLTRALQVELVRALGDEHVFFDRDSMAAGRSLDAAIPDAVRSADVVLAVVGHQWLNEFESRRQIRDDVRVELGETIIRRKMVAAGHHRSRRDPRPASSATEIRILRRRSQAGRDRCSCCLARASLAQRSLVPGMTIDAYHRETRPNLMYIVGHHLEAMEPDEGSLQRRHLQLVRDLCGLIDRFDGAAKTLEDGDKAGNSASSPERQPRGRN
jgi:hypothetical protein